MLEKLKYINHLNETVDFGTDGIYVNKNELRDYEWTITKRNDKIKSFGQGVVKRKLPVVIICDTVEKSLSARNRLYEVVEKDVLAQQYGRIVVDGYYMRCYVMKSQKKDYTTAQRYISLTLTVATDIPVWIRETKHIFRKSADTGIGGKNLDYPFDYAFDYKGVNGNGSINNAGIAESNFRLIIYGECVDPEIKIGNHLYKINGKIGKNEYMTIDSVTKEIFLTTNDGKRVNRFNDRYRRSYIFEKIPAGSIPVVWVGEYGFDLILYDERSEPKWT